MRLCTMASNHKVKYNMVSQDKIKILCQCNIPITLQFYLSNSVVYTNRASNILYMFEVEDCQ